MNVLCRGCRTEIDLNASNCPICLRPRDRSEMLEDSKRLREEQAAAKKRPWVILGWSVAIAGAGYAAWLWQQPLSDLAARARAKAGGLLETAADPKSYAPASAASAPASSPAPATTPAPRARPSASAPPTASAKTPAPPPVEAPPHDWTLPSPLNMAGQHDILIRGWVYDLVTARPIPEARLSFKDRLSGVNRMAFANASGYYELIVPSENSGLEPISTTAGYRPQPLDEDDPPWHARKPAARKKAAARQPGEMLLTFTSRQDEAIVNIILVPLPPR